ncbi:MAG: hypothetical protein ACK5LX_08765 [Oscillospiraceae bacterium]
MNEVFFAESYRTERAKADISMFVMCGDCAPVKHKVKHNLVIDLTQTEDEILGGMSREHRRVIRGCIRDEAFVIERIAKPSKEELDEFVAFFNEFSQNKGIYSLDAEHFKPYIDTGRFLLTKTRDRDSNVLGYLTYFYDEDRVSAQYSCSHFRMSEDPELRKQISHNTKYSHYSNMCYFKSLGLKKYDFGGLRLTPEGEPESGVDVLKLRFGGEIVTEYCFFYPNTLLGKLALTMRPKDPSGL